MTNKKKLVLGLSGLVAGVFLTACAGTPVTSAAAIPTTTPAGDFDKDHRAILAMLGEYEVGFAFEETVVLAPGYTRTKPKLSGGNETVILVEDTGRHVVLQHILVSDKGYVTKHWRQDWTYEAPVRLEFTEDQTWRLRPLAAEVTRGAWTQCVFEVSDAPRYCGTGKWNHRYGADTWTSDRSWRPLPRREYTTRSDYNALNVENRHTIVPDGWTHEQDNTKTVRKGEATDHTIVREFGFNDYHKTTKVDFKPAYDYWMATSAFWAKVRNEWQTRIDAGRGIHLKTPVDGLKIIEPLFAQAETIQEGGAVADADLRAVFDQWTEAASTATAQK